MCERNRFDTQTWLLEVQRDPRSLGAMRRRVATLLSDPWVARAVAARLAAGDARYADDAPPCPAEQALSVQQAPQRDFILCAPSDLANSARRGPDATLAGWL